MPLGLLDYGTGGASGYGYDPTREAGYPPSSQSQVPGTSGAPAYTPSATPGGVSQGDGTGTPNAPTPSVPYDYGAIPYGGLAASLAMTPGGASAAGAGGLNKNALAMAQMGQKMMAPQAPMAQPQAQQGPGQIGPGQVQNTAQQQQITQIQHQMGVDYQTAVALYYMMQGHQGGQQGGGYGAAPASVPGMAYGGRPTGPTLVGERGPELFVPDMPGSIVPLPTNRMPPTQAPQMDQHSLIRQRNAAIHAALARRRF